VKIGYKNPQTKQTIEPNAMTGTRPIRSVKRPLNGRESPAVNVNKPMIAPLYSAPPISERYPGSSGMSMLKLEEKRNELRPSNQNCVVKILGELVLCITQKYGFDLKNEERLVST